MTCLCLGMIPAQPRARRHAVPGVPRHSETQLVAGYRPWGRRRVYATFTHLVIRHLLLSVLSPAACHVCVCRSNTRSV